MKLFPRPVRDRLLWAAAAGVVLPWVAGEWVKRGLESSMPIDLVREEMIVDFIVVGTIFTSLSWC